MLLTDFHQIINSRVNTTTCDFLQGQH